MKLQFLGQFGEVLPLCLPFVPPAPAPFSQVVVVPGWQASGAGGLCGLSWTASSEGVWLHSPRGIVQGSPDRGPQIGQTRPGLVLPSSLGPGPPLCLWFWGTCSPGMVGWAQDSLTGEGGALGALFVSPEVCTGLGLWECLGRGGTPGGSLGLAVVTGRACVISSKTGGQVVLK